MYGIAVKTAVENLQAAIAWVDSAIGSAVLEILGATASFAEEFVVVLTESYHVGNMRSYARSGDEEQLVAVRIRSRCRGAEIIVRHEAVVF